jgi:hypothetical protein
MYVTSGPPSISHLESPGSNSGLPMRYLGWKCDIGTCCSVITFGLSLKVLIQIRPLYLVIYCPLINTCSWPAQCGYSYLTLVTRAGGKHIELVKNTVVFYYVTFLRLITTGCGIGL